MTYSLRLSDRDHSIVQTVTRFRQVSSSQLRRLAFADGSPRSQGVRQRRTLARLSKWGVIQRLPRPVGGLQAGSGEFIYIPVGSRTRAANPHTLDIVETYVKLVEAERRQELKLLAFDPEPWCHVEVGHIQLKPDAFMRIETPTGIYRWFVEIDEGTEYRSQLSAKMRRYNQAYPKWSEPTFPQVVFLALDKERLRFINSVVKRQHYPSHFQVWLLDQAVGLLGQ